MAGDQICIGPQAILASVAPPATTPTATPVETAVPVPTNAATGSNPKCGLWYTTISGDICSTISGQYSISFKDLYFLNPTLDAKCFNLQVDVAYCVRAVGDITAHTGYDGADPGTTTACDVPFPASTCYQDASTLPTVPFLEADATFTRHTKASTTGPTRTRSFTTEAPSPTAPGSRTDCLKYANYFSTEDAAVDKIVNSCASIARYNEVTVAQLLEWNKSLKAASCALLLRYTYCVRAEDGTSSTAREDDNASTLPATSLPTTAPSSSKTLSGAPPAQTQPGIVAGCNKYAVQSGQQYCYDMTVANGITLDQLYKWNPALNGDCSGMYGGYAYCVGVSS